MLEVTAAAEGIIGCANKDVFLQVVDHRTRASAETGCQVQLRLAGVCWAIP
jgi:hypothetical protein